MTAVVDHRKFNLSGWLLFGSLLLLWELGARSVPKLQFFLPPVSEVVSALVQLLVSGAIVKHLSATLQRFFAGYFLAAGLAVLLGLLLGYLPALYRLCGLVIELLRPMPSVAIIPVAILLLGLGDTMIIAVTIYASIWSILVNTIDGVRHIEPTLIHTAQTFGLNRWQILWRIIFPAASPYIVTGLRIGLSIALILVTTAEMIVGSRGLGFFILDEERAMNAGNMYAGVILVTLLGYGLNRAFLSVERRLMRWRHGMLARGGA